MTFNNFFVFDLSGINGLITSAVFSGPRFTSAYDASAALNYSLFRVSAPVSTLVASHSGADGLTIFNDLNSGRRFGTQIFAAGDLNTPVAIDFTTTGLIYLNAARGTNFGFGGAISAVPEPATWGMMFLGLGAVGAAVRYRRRSTKTSYA